MTVILLPASENLAAAYEAGMDVDDIAAQIIAFNEELESTTPRQDSNLHQQDIQRRQRRR